VFPCFFFPDALEILTAKKEFIKSSPGRIAVGHLLFALKNSPDERCKNFLEESLADNVDAGLSFYSSRLRQLVAG